MSWAEISKRTYRLKDALEDALSVYYKKEQGHFISDKGDRFSLFTFREPEIAIGIEYNDEDDGDLFYPSDYDSLEAMLNDMRAEIDD